MTVLRPTGYADEEFAGAEATLLGLCAGPKGGVIRLLYDACHAGHPYSERARGQ